MRSICRCFTSTIIILDCKQNNFLVSFRCYPLFIIYSFFSGIFSTTYNEIYIFWFANSNLIEIWMKIWGEENRNITRFVKFLSYPHPIRIRGIFVNAENGSKRRASNSRSDKSPSRIWKLDGELCSKPRSKGRREVPKGKATPNPRPGRPPSSSCFPAICKVACAHRRPSYRHRTPSRKISKCFLARWIFVSRGWIAFPLTPPSLRI